MTHTPKTRTNDGSVPRGAFYVGGRVTGAGEALGPDGVTRRCIHCNDRVWVGDADVALADSCAAVACSHCTGTAEGILYIAP